MLPNRHAVQARLDLALTPGHYPTIAKDARIGDPWSPTEQRAMIGLLEHDPPRSVARRRGRSTGGVVRQVRRSGETLSAIRTSAHGMSVQETAWALGVAPETVRQWLRSGALPAKRVRLYARHIQVIVPDALTAWLYARGALLSFAPNDLAWAEIVGEARAAIAARMIAVTELARLLGRTVATFRYLRKHAHFPAPVLCLYAFGGAYLDRQAVAAWLLAHPAYLTPAARQVFLA